MSIEDTIKGLRNDNEIALKKQEKERNDFFAKFSEDREKLSEDLNKSRKATEETEKEARKNLQEERRLLAEEKKQNEKFARDKDIQIKQEKDAIEKQRIEVNKIEKEKGKTSLDFQVAENQLIRQREALVVSEQENQKRIESQNKKARELSEKQIELVDAQKKSSREFEQAKVDLAKTITESKAEERKEGRVDAKAGQVAGLVAGGTNLGLGTGMLIEEAKKTNQNINENEEILSLMKAEAEKQGLDINKNQKFLALSAKNDRMKMKLDGINAGRLSGMFKRFRASIPSREELKEQSRVFAGISGTLEGVAKGVGGFAKAAGTKTVGALGGLMGMIKGLMKGGLLIGALILFRQFINSPYFKQLISLIKETVIPALERMIKKLKPPIMEFINYLGKVLPGIFNAIFGEGGLFDNAVSYFEGVMELIKGIFTGDVDLIFGGIKKMFSSVVNAIDNIIKAILEFFGVENFSIIDKVKEIFTKIGNFIQGIIDNVVGVLRKIPLIGRFFKDEDAKKLGMTDEVEDSKDKGRGRGRGRGKGKGKKIPGKKYTKETDPTYEEDRAKLLKLREANPEDYNAFIKKNRIAAEYYELTPVQIKKRPSNPFAGQGQTAGGDTGGASIVDVQTRSEANRFAGRGRGGRSAKRSRDAKEFKEQQKLMNQSGVTMTGGQLDQDTREYLARTGPQLAIDQKKPPVIINAPTTNVDGSTKTESVTFMSPSNPDKTQMLVSEAADY